MQNVYFECKIQYEKTKEDGIEKKVSETYLLDAVSFTEAEARLTEEVTPFISGDYTISDIKRAKYSEIITSRKSGDDRWYKAKLMFVTLDEKSGKEKRSASLCLVQGKDFRTAFDNLVEAMKGTMSDYETAAISETQIMDVFLFDKSK